ncbi:glycosyltransferase family 4 protein [Alkanindiges illinoisensis]|uniref:Glycosyltransferase family 1 protein n=1 Tax=Alkanindiges illinoisensis TaxID=197183 RepID=A0A4Y7XEH0_9GAMM|nr:glycosyltransferase family 1 protein [Alkanindiges illinoisensis]TEU30125.1 glycosyltransferase family 1 protein [Alkanindiges illinoisensis]
MSDVIQGRVAIDATRQYRRVFNQKMATGIDKVDLAYIRQYQTSANAVLRLKKRWFVLNANDSAILFGKILQNRSLSRIELLRFCANTCLSSKRRYPTVLINTSHSGLEQADYSIQAKRLFKRVAYFLHDIIPLEYPEYCKAGETLKHEARVKTIVQSGHLVITNSQDTLDKFKYFSQQQFKAASLPTGTVALLGTELHLPVPQRNKSEILIVPGNFPYFVILGTIEPRKNHLLLLQVWRRLAEQLKENCPKLYIIGKRGWDIEQVIDILERAPYAKQHILEISNACDMQVNLLLQDARALLFPSFAEGFGLPLVQALQLSTPVIASDLPVFKELANTIPDYADPIDVMQWMHLIINYSSDNSTLRTAQLERLANFQAFSWKEHFNIVTPQLNHLFVS